MIDTTFRYYQNNVWRRVKIHASNCSFCNGGKGIHINASEENGSWSDAFSTIDEAVSAASETGLDVSHCKRCMKMYLTEPEDISVLKLEHGHVKVPA